MKPQIERDIKMLSYGIMYERNRLYFERFKLVSVLIPPLPEQKAIADQINRSTIELNSSIAHTEREIGLLREYRIRLIADVVTGKLDVRDIAAGLPDEIEEVDNETEPLVDSDLMEEEDISAGETDEE